MEDERWQLYYQLIQELLNCPEGEEINLLEANRNLVDLGLLITMEQLAVHFTENDNPNTAEWLRNMAQWLVKQIGFDSLNGMYADYLNCLMSILQAVAENSDPKSVYPILASNLDKLNLNLGIVLQIWAAETLGNANPEDADSMAVDIFNFGKLIQEFRQGNVIYLANRLGSPAPYSDRNRSRDEKAGRVYENDFIMDYYSC